MSGEPKRPDSQSIDWSTKSTIDWSSSPIDWSSSLAPEPQGEVSLEAEPPPPEAPEEPMLQLSAADLEDDEEDYHPHEVDRRIARSSARREVAPAVGRSGFAALVCLAFSGYLLWMAVQTYQDLGVLHARSVRAAPRDLDALRREHGRVTQSMLLHLAAASPLLVGAFCLLARKRGAGQLFMLVGIATTIYLATWSLNAGLALRADDLLTKLCGIALCAWVRPRAAEPATVGSLAPASGRP